jgi:hypothetical protein
MRLERDEPASYSSSFTNGEGVRSYSTWENSGSFGGAILSQRERLLLRSRRINKIEEDK